MYKTSCSYVPDASVIIYHVIKVKLIISVGLKRWWGLKRNLLSFFFYESNPHPNKKAHDITKKKNRFFNLTKPLNHKIQ